MVAAAKLIPYTHPHSRMAFGCRSAGSERPVVVALRAAYGRGGARSARKRDEGGCHDESGGGPARARPAMARRGAPRGAGDGGQHLGVLSPAGGEPVARGRGGAFLRIGVGRLHRGRGGARGVGSDERRRSAPARVRRQQRTGVGGGTRVRRSSPSLCGKPGSSRSAEVGGRIGSADRRYPPLRP